MKLRLLAALAALVVIWGSLAVVASFRAGEPSTRAAAAQGLEPYALVDIWARPRGLAPAGFILEPAGVAVRADGSVFVVDAARAQVHVFSDERFVDTWGGRGNELGKMDRPHGIALLGDMVIVADTNNNRLQLFEPNGQVVAAWGNLHRPWDVAVGPDGRVLVTEAERDRIAVLDSEGVLIGRLGEPGMAFGELNAPRGVDVWPDGRIAVLDAGNKRVQIWERDGTPVGVITNTALLPLVGVAAQGTDHLLVATLRSITSYEVATGRAASVSRASVPGGFTDVAALPSPDADVSPTVWAPLTQDDLTGLRRVDSGFRRSWDSLELPAPAGELSSPRRIDVDGGIAYVLDAWPRIQRLSTSGDVIGQRHVPDIMEIAPHGGYALAANGTSIGRLSLSDSTWTWRSVTNTAWFAGLALSEPAGELYALDLLGQSVQTYDFDGTWLRRVPLQSNAYSSFTDIDVRADGRLLVANRTLSQVDVLDRFGSRMEVWPVRGVPLRVAAEPAGGAFVLTREGWVWKLGPNGETRAWWDAAVSDVPGEVARRGIPSDIAVDEAGRVYVTDGRADRVLVFAPDPTAIPEPPPSGSGCVILRDKWASPPRITLGETVGVTLTIVGECMGEGQGADIVLVLDGSGSMAGRKLEAARSAAISFVGEIDFAVSRVGLVVFNLEAQMPAGLTTDASAVVEAIVGFGQPAGGTDIGEAIQVAARELTANGRPNVERIIVLMTDGRPEGDVVDADTAARAAKDEGLRLFAIGFGSDADPVLMKRIATSAADYYFAPTATELSRIYTEIAQRIAGGIVMQTTTITDVVPANMLYVPGSAAPAPVSFANRTLRWEFSNVRGGLDISYRLRPLETGTWPTNVEARSRYRDGHDYWGALVFPVPRVIVVAPPRPVYLPLVGGRICRPAEMHADVALVIDTSSSMTGEKLLAAQAAAQAFVGLLALPQDQAAVVGFNRIPLVAAGLTGNRAALRAAIDGLGITRGTVIDSGLRAATVELGSPRAIPENNKVIVLLTDGRNNAGPKPVLEAAAEAKLKAIAIYTIALGQNADRQLMQQVAGAPERSYVAPTPADLLRIYRDIAGVIPCP